MTGAFEAHEQLALNDPTYCAADYLLGRRKRLLDVGCGEGYFLLRNSAGFAVGVDRDLARLRMGKQAAPALRFVCAQATALPFSPASFDSVAMIGLLPYLPAPVAALAEAARVTIASGRVLVSTAARHWLYRLVNVHGWRHVHRYYSPERLAACLGSAGLACQTVQARGPLLAPLFAGLATLPSWIDRILLRCRSVIGPAGFLYRRLLYPAVGWEYRLTDRHGYQLFALAEKVRQ